MKKATAETRAEYQLKLYVAGQTTKSRVAIDNLERLCETHLAGRYTIEVIDLLINPKLAAGLRYWQYLRWFGICPSRSRRSSATCRATNACW